MSYSTLGPEDNEELMGREGAADIQQRWDREQFLHRHPATQASLRWFEFGHLPEGLPRTVSGYCASLAVTMVQELQDSAELTAGLRKLREAKDCFVFEAVTEQGAK